MSSVKCSRYLVYALRLSIPKLDAMDGVALDLTTAKVDGDLEDSSRSSLAKQTSSGVGHRLRVTFDKLEYVVQNQANRSEKLSILKGVSGFCNPGE